MADVATTFAARTGSLAGSSALRRRRASVAAARSLQRSLVLAGALLLAACGAPGGDVSGDPTPTGDSHSVATASTPQVPLAEVLATTPALEITGPSTALLATNAVEVVTPGAVPVLPTTVTSHDHAGDVEVTVGRADRVIALDQAGTVSATVWALGQGDRLVARDIATLFDGAKELPNLMVNGHTLNAETILAYSPDLVITDGTVGPREVFDQLRDAGVTVVVVQNEPSVAGAEELARQVGDALGVSDAGDELAAWIGAGVDQVVADIQHLLPAESADRPAMAFLYVRGDAGIYYLFGEGSGADEIIALLGGRDVASDIGWEGMRPMTDEAIVAADPQLLLVMTGGLESTGGVDGLLAARPAVALTTAGENRRIVDMDDGEILSFGPRTAAVLDALARAVYAPTA